MARAKTVLLVFSAGVLLSPSKVSTSGEPNLPVEFVRNYDGDTITVNIASLPPIFGHEMPVRIAHIDTPEILGKTDCERELAQVAKKETFNLLSKAKTLTLIYPKRGKYFRLVADVLVDKEILLSEYLLEKDLAYVYEGDSKPSIDWCDRFPQ